MLKPMLYNNGVDGTTGKYLLEPLDLTQLAQDLRPSPPRRGALPWIEEQDLASAGWGIIFPRSASPGVLEALHPLIAHRRQQARATCAKRFRIFWSEDGYHRGETKAQFFQRHGIEPGSADPDQLPYYLLLVEGPDAIPFDFQYELDVQYAVGRLAFDDLDAYARYAETVVAAETAAKRDRRGIALWGPCNPDDPATDLSCQYLIEPLTASLQALQPATTVRSFTRGSATKECLLGLLSGQHRPALLVTASHGVGFPCGHSRQRELQGALLCQDWPGPKLWRGGEVSPTHFFAAEDLTDEADVRGLIAFHFACYGAGTPQLDSFSHRLPPPPSPLAPQSFLARLPQKLLSHPNGSALAIVGHVDRAWGFSFFDDLLGSQVKAFRVFTEALLRGFPVGAAMEAFHQKYVDLVLELHAQLPATGKNEARSAAEARRITALWTASQDARSFVLLGDPAVRMKQDG